jgi:hypothetical protein
MKIVQTCKCISPTFLTSRGIQVDVEINKDGEHIKDWAFGDYYDHIGENKVTCKKCGKEADVQND